MNTVLHTVQIGSEQDVVTARQRARQIAALLGFDTRDQTRIATAVSEIARNASQYANGGRVDFILEGTYAPQRLRVCIRDRGSGIANADRLLSGHRQSRTGRGLGLHGSLRLVDRMTIRSAEGGGAEVVLDKNLPAGAGLVTEERVREIIRKLEARPSGSAIDELRWQNQELLGALSALRERQEELLRLNRDLAESNRRIVALCAELDARAGQLRRIDEMKSRFLSSVSHELRTPLNSIRVLSRLLLDRADGELSSEQERQVGFIAKSADDLAALVDDLLDLAKIEAGRMDVRPTDFSVAELFAKLRGMLRPLLTSDDVELVFEYPDTPLTLCTDEGKVSQILRNLVSNAIKFTERGEVRVSAAPSEDGRIVRFSVVDTGIGIEPEYQSVIFEEFSQVPNPLQGRVKGTGLGLSLCRRLAVLLGGDVELQSVPGVGSCFTAVLPARYGERIEARPAATARRRTPSGDEAEWPGLPPHIAIGQTDSMHRRACMGTDR